MRYRKRPVIIEALRYDGRNTVEIAQWLREGGVRVGWSNSEMKIPTLEGDMTASPGDWIIKGVSGEFYPCKPDIFDQTYEPVDAASSITAQVYDDKVGKIRWRAMHVTASKPCSGPSPSSG